MLEVALEVALEVVLEVVLEVALEVIKTPDFQDFSIFLRQNRNRE